MKVIQLCKKLKLLFFARMLNFRLTSNFALKRDISQKKVINRICSVWQGANLILIKFFDKGKNKLKTPLRSNSRNFQKWLIISSLFLR